LHGEVGFYIPYIYVTNDAALAIGREWIGAPKKLAKIQLKKEYDVVQGTLERPSGKRLVTLTVKPNSRAANDVIDAYFPDHTLTSLLGICPRYAEREGSRSLSNGAGRTIIMSILKVRE
jgi:acetoacetate decarboxylase